MQTNSSGDRMFNKRKTVVGTTLIIHWPSRHWTAMNEPGGEPYLSMWLTNHGLYLSWVCRATPVQDCTPCLSGTCPRWAGAVKFAWLVNRSKVFLLLLWSTFSATLAAEGLRICFTVSTLLPFHVLTAAGVLHSTQFFVTGSTNQYLPPLGQNRLWVAVNKCFLKLMTSLWPTVDLYFLKAGQLWFTVHFTVGPFISFWKLWFCIFISPSLLFNIQGKVIFSNQKKVELGVN